MLTIRFRAGRALRPGLLDPSPQPGQSDPDPAPLATGAAHSPAAPPISSDAGSQRPSPQSPAPQSPSSPLQSPSASALSVHPSALSPPAQSSATSAGAGPKSPVPPAPEWSFVDEYEGLHLRSSGELPPLLTHSAHLPLGIGLPPQQKRRRLQPTADGREGGEAEDESEGEDEGEGEDAAEVFEALNGALDDAHSAQRGPTHAQTQTQPQTRASA